MKKSPDILIILNPAARGERASALEADINALSERTVVRITDSAGGAKKLAQKAVQEGFKTIVAAGGDGTINEVVNGLVGTGVHFGILPVGTMNVFATELGVPQNLKKAWEIIEAGHIREVDIAKANEEYFVQLAGVGLDAEVVRRTTSDSKKMLGPVSYLLTLAQVAARRPPTVKIETDGGATREGSFVLIGNGRFYGGPFVLFQDARLDDGLLDVLVFKNQSHWDIMRYFQAIVFGSHTSLPDVEYFQTSRLRLSSAEEVPVELDGETCGTLPCEFRLSERRLKVLAPPAGTSD